MTAISDKREGCPDRVFVNLEVVDWGGRTLLGHA